MKEGRYYGEVERVMSGRMSPKDFVETIYGPDFDWSALRAARRIFIEDGGSPSVFDDFSWDVKFPKGLTLTTNF